jgi:hypothetical protein
MSKTDPYPAVGTNYRPNFQPSTTNRSVTLTKEQVEELKDILGGVVDPSQNIVKLYDVVCKL